MNNGRADDVSAVVIISKPGWYEVIVVRSCTGIEEGIELGLRGYGLLAHRERKRAWHDVNLIFLALKN